MDGGRSTASVGGGNTFERLLSEGEAKVKV